MGFLAACAHRQTPGNAPIRFQGQATDAVGDAITVRGDVHVLAAVDRNDLCSPAEALHRARHEHAGSKAIDVVIACDDDAPTSGPT